MPPDRPNPFARPSARSRAAAALGPFRFVVPLARRFVLTVRHAPLVVRILLALVVVAGVGGAGYYLVNRRAKIAKQRAVADGWQEFETEVRSGGADPEDLVVALEKVLAANPTEPTALRRKAALARWEADPDDEAMIHLMLRLHLNKGRTEAAGKEAAKRLANHPNDYLAHCAMAAAALARGDRPAADPHLTALADPDANDAQVDPSGLRFALLLYQTTGRDPAPIRQFAIARLLPLFRGEAVKRLSPVGQATLIVLYADLFGQGAGEASTLSQYWGPVSRIAAAAVDGAKANNDIRTLATLADTGNRMATGLTFLRATKQVTDEEYPALAAELEDRTRSAWQAVLAADPKNAAAHHGLTLSYLRSNLRPEAAAAANAGLRAGTDDLRLYRLLALLLQAEGRETDAVVLVRGAAERNSAVAGWWLLLAEVSQTAGRRDLALDALKKAKVAAPTAAAIVFLEARLWLDAGNPQQALTLLKTLDEATLAKDGEAARAYTRALVETNDTTAADAFSKKAEASATATNNPAIAVGSLRGRFDAPPDATRATAVLAGLAAIQTRWPGDPAAALLRSEAAVRALDLGPAVWPESDSRAAERAAEVAASLNPGNLRPVAGRAWVLARGLNRAAEALAVAAPLKASSDAGTLPAEFAEVLAEVLLLNGKTEEALRVLARPRASRDASAGCLILTARCYLARSQTAEAQAELRAASGRPQSPRERADYQAAAKLAFK